jgi:hypothetical protein
MMQIDPNVQVAIVTAFATAITTAGVIAVAIINNRKERAGAAEAGVEAGLDDKDVLERILALIAENERKEEKIQALLVRVDITTAEKLALTEENRMLRGENTQLMLQVRELQQRIGSS